MTVNKKTVIIFHSLGPYHLARLSGAQKYQAILAVELSASTNVYQWEKSNTPKDLEITTIVKNEDSRNLKTWALKKMIYNALNEINPTSVFVNGWSDRGALLSYLWCREKGIPVFAMSESNIFDFKRKKVTEWVKKQIVKGFSGALVGGETHANYLMQLGLKRSKIFKGYDVVNNDFFASEYIKKTDFEYESGFILTSCRFIHKKNLLRLIDAYSDYVSRSSNPKNLMILGDGELKSEMVNKIKKLKLESKVFLPGFKQIDDLPTFYNNASAFILPSTREQWGLVVNEAMAAGLPVLVSKQVGSAHELIEEGKNGFTFNPFSVEDIALSLLKTDIPSEQLISMGKEGKKKISNYSPDLFGESVASLNEIVRNEKISRISLFDNLLIRLLCLFYD